MPSLGQALQSAVAALGMSPTARLDAEVLLAHILQSSRAHVLARSAEPLAPDAAHRFGALVERRAAGEPVAYLVGRAWFYGLELAVSADVLVPRPETEALVEWTLGWVRARRRDDWGDGAGDRGDGVGDRGDGVGDRGDGVGDRGDGAGDRGDGAGDRGDGAGDRGDGAGDYGVVADHGGRGVGGHYGGGHGIGPLRLIDVGTGSGAIAVALATHLAPSDVEIVATDVSAAALRIASGNAARLGVANRIRFVEADLLAAAPERFDVVVANLPYVGLRELGDVDLDVLRWEPHVALFAGPNGLDVIRRLLVDLAPNRLERGGAIALEIGWRQGQAVVDLARAALPEAAVELRQDFAGLDRMVVVQMPG